MRLTTVDGATSDRGLAAGIDAGYSEREIESDGTFSAVFRARFRRKPSRGSMLWVW
jgi:hypothetical protein